MKEEPLYVGKETSFGKPILSFNNEDGYYRLWFYLGELGQGNGSCISMGRPRNTEDVERILITTNRLYKAAKIIEAIDPSVDTTWKPGEGYGLLFDSKRLASQLDWLCPIAEDRDLKELRFEDHNCVVRYCTPKALNEIASLRLPTERDLPKSQRLARFGETLKGFYS